MIRQALTWFTAGTTVHIFCRCSRYGTLQFDTPIALTLPARYTSSICLQVSCWFHEKSMERVPSGLVGSRSDVSLGTRRLGDIGVRTMWFYELLLGGVNLHGPVNEIQIQVVCLKILQGLGQTGCDIGLMCVPTEAGLATHPDVSHPKVLRHIQLAGDEDFAPRHSGRLDGVSNLLLCISVSAGHEM